MNCEMMPTRTANDDFEENLTNKFVKYLKVTYLHEKYFSGSKTCNQQEQKISSIILLTGCIFTCL